MTRAGMIALALALPMSVRAETARTDYILHCAGCHGMEGRGTEEGGVPAFPGSVGRIAAEDMGRTYMMHVPGVVSASLSDAEIAAVVNYILARWSETPAEPFTAAEVTRRRALPVPDVVATRRDLAEVLADKGIAIAPYPWP